MISPPQREQGRAAPPFAALALIGFLQAMAANAIGVGVPLQIVHLGGAPVVLGLAFTTWAAGRSLMGVVAGRRFDLLGGRSSLLMSFAATAIVTAVYATTRLPWLFVLMRLFQGLGAGLYWTAILAIVGDLGEGSARLRRLATFNNMVAVGGILGSLLGGWAIGAISRSAPMWCAMLLFAILTLVVLRIVPRGSHAHGETTRLPLGVRGAAVGASLVAAASQLPSLLTNAGLPLLLVQHGLGGRALGTENALMVAGALLGQALYTRYAAWGSTRQGTVFLYLLGAIALAAVGFGSGAILLLAIAVLGSSVKLLSIVWINTVQAVAGPGQVGRATGLTRSSSDLLSALTYPLVGVAEESLAITVAILLTVFAGSVTLMKGSSGKRWFGAGVAQTAKVAGD